MRDSDQTIIKFDYDKNFKMDDYCLSKSNKHVFDFLNMWPKWERNFVNVIGEKLSGKTHLMNIFLHKNKGIKFEGKSLKNDDLKKSNDFELFFNEIDMVSDYSVEKFDKEFIFYEVLFNGTVQNFINIMKNKKYNLNTQKKVWIIE